MRTRTKVVIAGLAILSLSSCTGLSQHSIFGSEQSGYISINADAAGMREFYRGNNGLVVTGKSAPNKRDEYHATQQAQDLTSLQKLQAELQARQQQPRQGDGS